MRSDLGAQTVTTLQNSQAATQFQFSNVALMKQAPFDLPSVTSSLSSAGDRVPLSKTGSCTHMPLSELVPLAGVLRRQPLHCLCRCGSGDVTGLGLRQSANYSVPVLLLQVGTSTTAGLRLYWHFSKVMKHVNPCGI